MSERFTPYEPPESTASPPEPKPLSPETRANIQAGPDAPTPGDLNHPMEGGGQGFFYGDGRGGLVTPEMSERYHSPENQIEKEPYTFRAVPADPQQAAGDASQATPADPQQAAGDAGQTTPADPPQAPGDANTAAPTDHQAKIGPPPPSDNGPPNKPTRQEPLSDRGRAAMQGPPPETYYPPLDPEVKLALSNIRDAPVEQRQQMMADLFRSEGKNLSNNAAVFGDHIVVRDESGFEWLINYKE